MKMVKRRGLFSETDSAFGTAKIMKIAEAAPTPPATEGRGGRRASGPTCYYVTIYFQGRRTQPTRHSNDNENFLTLTPSLKRLPSPKPVLSEVEGLGEGPGVRAIFREAGLNLRHGNDTGS
jgi:hypothetical protein